LHKTINDLKIPHKGSGCSDHLTASFGIATTEPGHYTKPWDLKDAADFALFQAKHTGRNKCCLVPAIETAQ
jgi:PleD family two-component response regulator